MPKPKRTKTADPNTHSRQIIASAIETATSVSEFDKIAHKKKALLIALERTLGNVADACKTVGVSRSTYYNYLREDTDFAELVSNIDESGLDYAESILKQKVLTGNMTAIIFYLKTKGKDRGYIETVNNRIQNPDGSKLFDWADLARRAEETEDYTDPSTIDILELPDGQKIDLTPASASENGLSEPQIDQWEHPEQ